MAQETHQDLRLIWSSLGAMLLVGSVALPQAHQTLLTEGCDTRQTSPLQPNKY